MDREMMKKFARAVEKFNAATISDAHGRFRSWEYCYGCFGEARRKLRRGEELSEKDYDDLALQLAFYLASWGMYRGSSFLLWKDYKVHETAVRILLEPRYDELVGIAGSAYMDKDKRDLLMELSDRLGVYYDKLRQDVKEMGGKKIAKNALSNTLRTKILMGTLGAVPAYDQFFSDAVKNYGVTYGTFGKRSLKRLAEFCERNAAELEELRKKISKDRKMEYPQMKIVDMGLWQIGMDEKPKSKKR